MRALRIILAFLLLSGHAAPLSAAKARVGAAKTAYSALPRVALPTLRPLALPSLSLSAPAAPIPRAPGRSAAPAPEPASDAAPADFSRKVQALSDAVAESAEALAEPGADDGRRAAAEQFRRLTGEAPAPTADEPAGRLRVPELDFTPQELRRVSQTSAALEKAVALAAGSVFSGAAIQVRSRGSSARLTHSEANPDYDLMARLPEAWSEAQAEKTVAAGLPALKAALAEHVRRETAFLFPGVALSVQVENPVRINDPADGRRAEGVTMIPVHVNGPQGLLIDADVSFTRRADYANDYPDYFQAQISAVRRLGGQPAVERVLRDIRLAKKLFTAVVGSYKPWRGGPSGVGVEQLVMQSGRVADSDQGRTILESGSFEKFMARIRQAAYDEEGRPRGLKKARQRWDVHNAFMRPDNFLDLMSPGAWTRLARAAQAYSEAAAAGRPVALPDLRLEKPAAAAYPKPRPAALPVIAAAPAPAVSVRFTTGARRWRVRALAEEALKRLAQEGIRADKTTVSWDAAPGRSACTVTLQLAPGADPGAAEQALRRQLLISDPQLRIDAARPAPGLRSPDAWLHLRARVQAQGRDAVERAAGRLARKLGLGRPELSAQPDERGAYRAGFTLGGKPRGRFAEESTAFFKKTGGTDLVAIAYPAADAAAPAPGRLTLAMLEKFTRNGPAPAQRGDAYLYAQGAKALPAGLEAAGAQRRGSAAPAAPGLRPIRALLQRRLGRVYVLLPASAPDGSQIMKPVRVPERLAQGVTTDTLVEVVADDKGIRALQPIGAYAADVIIGRAARVGTRLLLCPLFAGDPAKSLYQPMPIIGAQPRIGELLQVFVQPGAQGYSAVPLLDLGSELTPEIAAREIALRHGARGYFEESVIRQAEAVGRQQDPEADFKRMQAARGRSEDLRALPFVTIDPVGAGDLDDAYFISRESDGGYTWYLATADVAQYVRPGTPAFRAAARIGNTFYSLDKDGVAEYPMNHPVISKSVSSLLAGKDSLAMVSKMRFSPSGEFLLQESEVFLGLVRVQGRYTYDQVADLWKGRSGHGIAHAEQIALARELAAKLRRRDDARGKLALALTQTEHRKGPDGRWGTFVAEPDPLIQESHQLIEELKVYGNQAIAVRLEALSRAAGVPHISRVHPAQEQRVNERLRKELADIGAPWSPEETLGQYLAGLRARTDLSAEARDTAQILALRSRNSAVYSADDAQGHEGLALAAKAYDHPSTPIRRFSDMYNRALLEAYLEGSSPKEVQAAMTADMQALGFADLEEYLRHLNGREQAARKMDHEVDEFMSVYELSKPANQARPLTGFVKLTRPGRDAQCVIQLRELPATITLRGEAARDYQLLDQVAVTIKGADTARLRVDAAIRKLDKR